jgi:hypothetical protein
VVTWQTPADAVPIGIFTDTGSSPAGRVHLCAVQTALTEISAINAELLARRELE